MADALLWPLSTKEAFAMDDYLRRANPDDPEQNNNYWWLRSPGDRDHRAAAVDGVGNVSRNGDGVGNRRGVRPAFNFNLKSVIFTSAAAGGKSGTVGADSLEKIGEYMSGKEWKLTLKDGAHEKFKVKKVTRADEGKLKIEYSDAAVDGEKEYISAIVKTNAGGGEQFATWYGKLARAEEASSANDPSCELIIPNGLEPGDEIYVFNERCNANSITDGDTTTPAETDYASELIKVYTAPNPKITEQPAEELKLTYGDTTGNVLSVKAEAASGNTLSYQWYYKDSPSLVSGTKIDNATGDSYTVPTDQNVGKKLYYYCDVTEKDQYGFEMSSKSNLAAVTISRAKITITADDKSSKAGEALKELTYKVNGDIVQGDDLGITVSTDADKDKAGTYDIKAAWNNNKNYEATLVNGKYTVTAVSTPVPSAPKTSGTPLAKVTVKKKSMTIGWNKIEGAEGYDIFFATCNHSGKKIACKNVKTIKGNKTFKWTKSGLKKGTAYKFYVRAYVTKNEKKTYISKSPMMHAYTGNGTKNYTNAKSVTIKNVKKGKLSLTKGKTFKIKAKVNKVSKKKKLMPKKHAATLRYMTSNSKVATVTRSGKIKARGKGECVIYVFAHNGVYRKITVTVN